MTIRRALVLGGGGPLGMAWSVGALAALEDHLGWDARDADVLVGTSCGAVLASLLRFGLPARSIFEAQLPGAATDVADASSLLAHHLRNRPSLGRPGRTPGSIGLVARAACAPWRHGPWGMAAGLLPEGRRSSAVIDALLDAFPQAAAPMPRDGRTQIVAMSYRTGARQPFGSESAPAATWRDAVAASVAFPGWFAPVTVERERYIDGGLYSPCSADLVRDAVDEAYVIAPLALSGRWTLARWTPPGAFDHGHRLLSARTVAREVATLRGCGVSTVLIAPDAEERRLMGANPMRITAAAAVTEFAHRHTWTVLASGLCAAG